MFRRNSWIWLTIAIAGTLGVVPLRAQVIRGRVLDDATDAPVAGVIIILSRAGAPESHAVSDEAGGFTLRPGTPGTYTVRAIRLGYAESVVPALELPHEGTTLDFDLLMSPKPVALEGLVVSASRYQSDIESLGLRMEDLGNRILTREDLDGMGYRDVGAALERAALPGIDVTRAENISAMEGATLMQQRVPFCVRLARARSFDGSQHCALVVLDQSVVSQEAIDALTPADLEAVIVLPPNEATQRFGLLGGYGAVLLYTRRGRPGG